MKFQHIYLTGYRGTGKSSVAARLAIALAQPAVDLDEVIETRAGQSIREIFAEGGESGFRDLERSALREVAAGPSSVIALGGGAVLCEENREVIQRSGTCFWLDAAPETLAARIAADASTGERRPALTELSEMDEIRRLLQSRRPLYEAAAKHRVETDDRSVDEVAENILTLIQVDSPRAGEDD